MKLPSASADRLEPGERRQQPTRREPDPRFLLAIERTFLAWNRTALALIAAGLAAASFLHTGTRTVLSAIAVALVVAGGALAVGAFQRWRRTEAAVRSGQPLPSSSLPQALTGGVVAFAVAAIVLVVILGDARP